MLIEINKIKVTDRIRKDFGNIEELANDIQENGLINPPVVTPEYELIAGERRLRACKILGYQQIEVRVMSVKDSEHQLKIEISENENRKEFTFSERVDWAKRLERIEKIKAEDRKKSTQFGDTVMEDVPYPEQKGTTRDIVADKSGFGSGKNFERAKYIQENADEEMIKALDEGKLSINKAYITLKQEKEGLERQLQIERNKQPKVIDNTDYNTINKLKSDLSKKEKDMEFLKKDKDILERKVKLNEEDAKKYNDLKKQIEYLKSEKEDIARQIESATSISGLIVEVENMIRSKLAPIQYSRAIQEQLQNPTVINNVVGIVERVEKWCIEMRKIINQDFIEINKENMTYGK